MQYCPVCKTEIKKPRKFCPKCGAKVSQHPADSKKLKMLVIALIVVIIAIVAVVASGVITSDSSGIDTGSNVSESNGVSQDSQSSSAGNTSKYFASAKSDKFHSPDCEWAEKISDSNKIVYPSRQAAIDAGKIPCGVCNP